MISLTAKKTRDKNKAYSVIILKLLICVAVQNESYLNEYDEGRKKNTEKMESTLNRHIFVFFFCFISTNLIACLKVTRVQFLTISLLPSGKLNCIYVMFFFYCCYISRTSPISIRVCYLFIDAISVQFEFAI